MGDLRRDKDGNWLHPRPQLEALTSGMEQRIIAVENKVAELQDYVAEQTPFNTENAVSCEWCNYCVCQCEDKEDDVVPNDRNDLIDVIAVAFKGLKPDATINQQNIAYYAVRSVLNQEE